MGWDSRQSALRLGPHKMLTGRASVDPGPIRVVAGRMPVAGPLFPQFVMGVATAKDMAQLRGLLAARQALGFGGP